MPQQNSNNTLLTDLKEQIKNKQVVTIIGTGVSLSTTNNPVASWVGLLKDGVERCRQVVPNLPDRWSERLYEEIQSGDMDDLLSAAQKIGSKLKQQGGEFPRWIRETIGTLRVGNADLINAIASLGIPIATTNYDGLIEEVTGWPPITWQDQADVERILRGADKGVIHLHGFWRRADSIILDINSYNTIINDNHAQAMLRAMRAMQTLLFIGFGAGLNDPNFGPFLKWAETTFPQSEYRHYRLALQSEVDSIQRQHDPTSRIYVIPYGTKHTDLPAFIHSLASNNTVNPT